MKAFAFVALALFSSNAFAIQFITEDDVQAKLGVEKVIEIGSMTAEKLVQKDSDCEMSLMSKGSRAYFVKKDNRPVLVVTSEGLDGLRECALK